MSEPMAYIGRTKCGCLVAAVVDMQDRPKETAKDVAEFIASGLTIERVTCQYVRESEWGCKHPQIDPKLTHSDFGQP